MLFIHNKEFNFCSVIETAFSFNLVQGCSYSFFMAEWSYVQEHLRLISIPLLLLYRCGLDVVKRLFDTAIAVVSLWTGYSKVVVRHHCYPWVTVDWM